MCSLYAYYTITAQYNYQFLYYEIHVPPTDKLVFASFGNTEEICSSLYRNRSVCPFVSLSVCQCRSESGPSFLFYLTLSYLGTWVYHYETMCRAHS